ncbi:hypothetical protein [Salinisphaera japonica]|uniref:Lipoprotein n=1 Tax=Salinisphaera japonica YTM-1 TaxID=1209778 RepID=A0A423PWY4_9GAMM|nr:hypothetical protein [Salinisphaera japonica]ROO30123.1 hypothetical protein SAJA_05135 [Salinisphaera japonica YTM-1]
MRVLVLLCALGLMIALAGCSGARSTAGSVPAAAAAGSGGYDSQRRAADDTAGDEASTDDKRTGTPEQGDP